MSSYEAQKDGGRTHDTTTPAGSQVLWKQRDFGIFWAAQTLSVLGDSFALIALPLLVLQATGSVARMGLLTAVGGAAAVAAGVFAGVLVDRVDRRGLLITCDLVRMVLYGLIPLVWLFGPRIWLLYVVLPLCEAVGMLFAVGYVTVVRSLVGTEQLTEANGRLGATAAAAGVLGPMCAGLTAAWAGPAAAVGVDAGSFGVSAACLLLVRFRARPADARSPQRTGLWRDLRTGISFLYGHPVLRSLTALLFVYSFLTLGLTDLVIYHLKHDLGHDDGTVGTVMACGALGTIAGSLLVARIRRRLGFGWTWMSGVALCGVAFAGLGWAREVPVIAVLSAAFLACGGIAGTCSMSLRQEVTPEPLLGRVTSAFWTLHYSAAPVGAAVLTWAAEHRGTAPVALAAGGCCVLIAGAGLLTPIRGSGRLDRPAD
ncbi:MULTISPECIES: MFS transporter [unclassified Streptomyces]|uniref:MFS transporter n=1 Tax=unclassified Streptomyces TaxID=2593676 RepID=UPI00224E7169|nr:MULTISPECIES: MFS transporter [unclassified Streptomyces]MCX5051922.1 MFS transporter [Streptomyces sp. NBC_00474]MCX5062253.1 MFS transporter [Streptomyces sp. NBC_00452]MCX5249817.1 MFS transporter [Streptomyces sp. NBC_00201]MCX5292138.1 MFS transporter [Streptomyces sp. NBC_00183]